MLAESARDCSRTNFCSGLYTYSDLYAYGDPYTYGAALECCVRQDCTGRPLQRRGRTGLEGQYKLAQRRADRQLM